MCRIPCILAIVFFAFSCSSTDIWGYRASRFISDIENRDFSKIDSLDLSEEKIEKLEKIDKNLGDGAAWFLGLRRFINEDFGNYERIMYYQAGLEEDDGKFSSLAAEHLAEWYAGLEDWKSLYTFALNTSILFDRPETREYYQMLALYRMEDYAGILENYKEHDDMYAGGKLIVLVSLFETNSSRFSAELYDFILKTYDRELLFRLYLYLLNNEIAIPEDIDHASLMKAKLLYSAEEYGPASFMFRKAWTENSNDFLNPDLFDFFTDSMLQAKEQGYLREVLPELADLASPGSAFQLKIYWELGTMERRFSRYGSAEVWYEKIWNLTAEADRQRPLWYWFDSMARNSPGKFREKLSFLMANWKDADYFNDTFDWYINYLVRNRKFSFIPEFYNEIRNDADADIPARIAWVSLVLDSFGYLDLADDYRSEFTDLLDKSDPKGFIGIVSRVMQGKPLDLYDAAGNDSDDSAETAGIREPSEEERLAAKYLKFGLYEFAFELALDNYEIFSKEFLRTLSADLNSEGLIYESMRIIHRGLYRPDWVYDEQTYELYYPYVLGKEFGEALKDRDIPKPVFYSTVRAESFFNYSVISSAGAQGLSQLMPSTAADIAERLGIEEYDITDPVTNLSFGSWYLQSMREKFGDYAKALCAYNAGPGRLREWLGQTGDFPSLVFAESIPYDNTWNYMRNILAGALIYNELYFKNNPQEILALFFPEWDKVKLD